MLPFSSPGFAFLTELTGREVEPGSLGVGIVDWRGAEDYNGVFEDAGTSAGFVDCVKGG